MSITNASLRLFFFSTSVMFSGQPPFCWAVQTIRKTKCFQPKYLCSKWKDRFPYISWSNSLKKKKWGSSFFNKGELFLMKSFKSWKFVLMWKLWGMVMKCVCYIRWLNLFVYCLRCLWWNMNSYTASNSSCTLKYWDPTQYILVYGITLAMLIVNIVCWNFWMWEKGMKWDNRILVTRYYDHEGGSLVTVHCNEGECSKFKWGRAAYFLI